MAQERQTTTPDVPAAGKSAPTRSVDQIERDIDSERAALDKAFGELQRDVGQAVEDAKRRATVLGRKALIIVPAVGAAAGGLAAGIVVLSRRRRRA